MALINQGTPWEYDDGSDYNPQIPAGYPQVQNNLPPLSPALQTYVNQTEARRNAEGNQTTSQNNETPFNQQFPGYLPPFPSVSSPSDQSTSTPIPTPTPQPTPTPGPPDTNPPHTPPPPPQNQNNPTNQYFENVVTRAVNQLQGSVYDPRFDEVLANLRSQLQPNPQLQGIIGQLIDSSKNQNDMIRQSFASLADALKPHVDPQLEGIRTSLANLLTNQQQAQQAEQARQQELAAREQAAAELAQQRFSGYVLPRVAELRAEPFTQTEEAARRVAAFDNLERERQMTIANTVEQLGGLGHSPTSGIVQRAIDMVNQRFDQLHAAANNQLLLEGTQIREQRRTAADALMEQLGVFGLNQGQQGQQGSNLTNAALTNLIQAITGATGTLGNLNLGQQGLQTQTATALGNLGINTGQLQQTGAQAAGNLNIGNRGLDLNTLNQFGDLVTQIMGMNEKRIRDAVSTAALLPALQRDNISLALQLFGPGTQNQF